MSFNIKVDDKKATQLFSLISSRAKNPLKANKIIASKMRDDVIEHFRKESDENGKWTDLKKATWAWKAKRGKTLMLQNSGNLRERNLMEATNTKAVVYNDLEYAKDQNYGNTDKNLPARKFLWLSDKAVKAIVKIMTNYILKDNTSEWT